MSVESLLEKQSEGYPPADSDLRIRGRAYLLWESEGMQDGQADVYWHLARDLLIEDEAHSAYPPTQSRGHRT